MSKRNGDKARFNRERQKRQLRRQRSRDLRKTLNIAQQDQAASAEADPTVVNND